MCIPAPAIHFRTILPATRGHSTICSSLPRSQQRRPSDQSNRIADPALQRTRPSRPVNSDEWQSHRCAFKLPQQHRQPPGRSPEAVSRPPKCRRGLPKRLGKTSKFPGRPSKRRGRQSKWPGRQSKCSGRWSKRFGRQSKRPGRWSKRPGRYQSQAVLYSIDRGKNHRPRIPYGTHQLKFFRAKAGSLPHESGLLALMPCPVLSGVRVACRQH